MVPPLTNRELTVLRYLQGTVSHVEIAALLYISVNTAKTHVKNIYAHPAPTAAKSPSATGTSCGCCEPTAPIAFRG